MGSRKSQLALIQTKHVIACLQAQNPATKFEIHTMTTMGDRVLNKSLPKIGEKSLFTKDLEDALTNGGVDFVVHSLKDLPTALPVGMAIGAVLQREDPRDALVLNEKHKGSSLKSLPEGSVIGTSSLRRTAQLKRDYSHLVVCDIRGNLNTRLAKLDADNSQFAGIILAQAGLERMGWQSRINQVLEPDEILYAVGQGALAVECRSNDEFILEMLSRLCHLDTQCRILAERSFLKTLGGGCSAPVAVSTEIDKKSSALKIKGAVWSLEGKTKIENSISCFLDFDNDEVSPRKKLKTNHDEVDQAPKQSSPKVIDSSSLASGDSITISKLVEIHGDLFKKCPFASKITEKCPATTTGAPEFPVGQEVMGACPYFETSEKKVEALKQDVKCPITGESSSAEKCPFIAEQHKSQEEKLHTEENGVKLLDYVEQAIDKVPELVDHSSTLYCGMFRHKKVAAKLFEDCENLGKQLAENLINLGALDVMKVAQNFIREKV